MISRAQIAVTATAAFFLLAPASALGVAELSVAITPEATSLPLGSPANSKVTIAVTNSGPDSAEAVSGSATLGKPQLAFLGFTAISQGGAAFVAADDPPLTFNFGAIPAGVTATLNFTLNDSQSGLGKLTANATTPTPEFNTSNNTASASIEVTALTSSATVLPFGAQTVGGIAPAQTFTVTNRAGIPVLISNVKTAGGDFVVSSEGCSGTTLAVNASCAVAARFAPMALGERTDTMTVASSTAGVSPIEVELSGTATVEPVLPVDRSVDPSATLQLSGVPKSITAKTFRRGFPIRVTPNEAVAIDVQLTGKARAGALASAFDLQLFSRSLPPAAGPQTIKVRPNPSLLGPIRKKFGVHLKVTATDTANNRSSLTRKIAVKPPSRR